MGTCDKQGNKKAAKKKGNGKCGGNTQKCPHQLSMSKTEAQTFMDEFKKTKIPFDYPPDCCYARARVMAEMIEKKVLLLKNSGLRVDCQLANLMENPLLFQIGTEPLSQSFGITMWHQLLM